jgi:DsbC/DsbD-like thiol-disulfide interchange protein
MMIIRNFLLSSVAIAALASFVPAPEEEEAQKNPISWKFSSRKLTDQNNAYVISLKAKIDPEWHLYSQKASQAGMPTKVTFEENKTILKPITLNEIGEMHPEWNDVFMDSAYYYSDMLELVDTVFLDPSQAASGVNLKGQVSYMACTGEMCLPPRDDKFELVLQ